MSLWVFFCVHYSAKVKFYNQILQFKLSQEKRILSLLTMKKEYIILHNWAIQTAQSAKKNQIFIFFFFEGVGLSLDH